MQAPGRLPDPGLRSVLLLAGGVAGMALCVTLVYLGMRAVMDIGGSCADGGPYVSAHPCPDGVPGAMLLGSFGLFLFAGLAIWGATGTGGYGWIPLLAWTGLFATLGWNFLDYGLVNPPEGEGIEWGFVIPGVLFELMAWVPIIVLVAGKRAARGWTSAGGTQPMPGPGQGTRAEPHAATSGSASRPPAVGAGYRVEVAGSAPAPEPAPRRTDELQQIDGLMGSLLTDAAAEAPVKPASDPGATSPDATQALLDRLEHLGEMREKGLLTPEEYETTKAAVMHELEARS